MSLATTDEDPPTTIADFDAFVIAQGDGTLWELVAGRIAMMTNPCENHKQIAGNIGAPLKLAMDQRNCRTYQSGMRVQRADNARGLDKPRPDVVVRCGEPSNRHDVTDPIIVVEVLSPTTMDEDRGDKLRFYKSLLTIHHIVLVYQDSVRVEHYHRSETAGPREMIVLTQLADMLSLAAVNFEISLQTVYFGVLFATRE